MCSFLFTNIIVDQIIDYINHYLKPRGPDFTNIYKKTIDTTTFTFIHNLLHLTGTFTPQPFINYNIVCMFNGGIKKYKHSNFGGLYPDNLSLIFPKSPDDDKCIWSSFYGSTQEAYLMKEESISGMYGIEGIYPFLDKQLVQEFLWLIPELKNKNYKSVIDEYLNRCSYPYDKNIKIGFNI